MCDSNNIRDCLKYFFVAPDGTRANPVGRDAFMRVGREWDRRYGKFKWTVLDRCELVEPMAAGCKAARELEHVDAN